jgi:tetratricopeptide (TPR) repeat protein
MIKGFLSHSSKDKELVEAIAEKLGKDHVFFDKWDLDCGDILPSKLAEGIMNPDSQWFLLIASKDSMASKWVRWELNIAIVRQIQNDNFRIVVVRIDDCNLHPELTPYLYVNIQNNPQKVIEDVHKIISTNGQGIIPPAKSWRRPIVDRYEILGTVDKLTSVEGYKVIILWGMYGIGKTTLAEHISDNVFKKKLTTFVLTEGHDLLRLVLEMSVRARTPIPPPDATETEIIRHGIVAFEELVRRDFIIHFDDAELITDETRQFRPFFNTLLAVLANIGDIPPIIITSSHSPRLAAELQAIAQPVRVQGLGDEYIISILETWITYSDPEKPLPSKEKLTRVAKELFGYPLAAKLAAYDIVKYSIEQTISDLSYFERIRIDIAKQLLGRLSRKLDPLQYEILEILTVANIGLSQRDISVILSKDPEIIRQSIDGMFNDQLISLERNRLQIIPIMKDYFWKRIHQKHILKDISYKIALHCQNQLPAFDYYSEDYVHYCSIACRLFLLSDNKQLATEFMVYFKGELREAAIKLYHDGEYKLSLNYIDTWLLVSPSDLKAKWLKARCLTRLERLPEAEMVLKELESSHYPSFLVSHAWGLFYKHKNEYGNALKYFKRGLDDNPEHIALLRDYGDTLERVGDIDGAYENLKAAYQLAKRDRYVAPKFAAILIRKGRIDEAIEIMTELSDTYPDEAYFYHRLSTLYSFKGDFPNAYSNANTAEKLNPKLPEAITHLAALELKRDNLPRVNSLLKNLPDHLNLRQRRVRDTIFAEMLLKEGNLPEARIKLKNYDYTEDTYCAEILARIELTEASHFISTKSWILANERILKGLDIINATLSNYPKVPSLEVLAVQLNRMLDDMKKEIK